MIMSRLSSQRRNPSETQVAESSLRKSTMSSSGTKSVSATQRNRTPTLQSGRNTTQGETASTSLEDANKSQSSSARRSSTKSSVSPTAYKRQGSGIATGTAARFENQYAIKKKRYIQLRKELTDKQKIAQDTYNDTCQLREKVLASGGKDPGKLEDLKLEVGLSVQSAELRVRNEQADDQTDNLCTDNGCLKSLEEQLEEIPKKYRNVCQELLEKQSALLAFINSKLTSPRNEENEHANADLEIATQLEEHQKNLDNVRTRLVELETKETEAIEELMTNTRKVIEEVENRRAKLKEIHVIESQELQSQLNVAREELQVEKERNNQSKDRLKRSEMELQRAKTKIRELETNVANDETKIQQLHANIKSLELQMKQREQATEGRYKDMQKTVKNSEGLVAKLEKQRDSLETRLLELREKMLNNEGNATNTINELSDKLNTVSTKLAMEEQTRQQTEEAFCELEERYRNLEEKSKQFCELAEQNKEFVFTEGTHSENEARLFDELQKAKEELEQQKDQMMELQRQKEEITAIMHQAACQEEDEDSRQKLAAQLVLKSNELQKLMMQYSELKKVANSAQEKSGILERQLIEIQTRLQSQSREGGKAGLSAQTIELQQQVSDLRSNLAEVIRQNEELKTALTQKHLELEQREHVMREQSKILKVRNELLDILKGKSEENEEMTSSDENNEYIEQITAKTEAIQKLYATLESKQMQIMRLEKMVKLMEVQQDRAQAQRTRLENRIAQLELALQKTKEQRAKGFGIL